MRTCVDCGADISDRGVSAKRCEECALRRKNVRAFRERRSKGMALRIKSPFAKRCHGCKYHNQFGFCDYASQTGRTRLSIHNGENIDINRPCREREVKGT